MIIKIASKTFIWGLGKIFLTLMWIGEKLEELDDYYEREKNENN
jgi:hypothetical protein